MSKYRNIETRRFAEIFRALGNENRLKIFLRLGSCCESRKKASGNQVCACVGDLGKDLGLSASTVSHHIKELRRAGLICMDRNGQYVECRLDEDTLEEVITLLGRQAEGGR
jgi:DNA-binding transcriptional ArsR family regulator